MIAELAVSGWLAAGVVGVMGTRRLAVSRELAARACHEVRGPLTAAGMALHLMQRRGEAPAERLVALEEQLRRAQLALDDLAEAPAGRSTPDRLEPVSLAGIVAEVGIAWAPVCAARGRPLSVSSAPAEARLLADRTRLAQAAGNLVANALEHGRGAVDIRPRLIGDRVRLEVRDEGDGLGRPLGEILASARGGRTRRGHGLAIAAGIASRHGGRLITGPAGGGSLMALELPLREGAGLGGRPAA